MFALSSPCCLGFMFLKFVVMVGFDPLIKPQMAKKKKKNIVNICVYSLSWSSCDACCISDVK